MGKMRTGLVQEDGRGGREEWGLNEKLILRPIKVRMQIKNRKGGKEIKLQTVWEEEHSLRRLGHKA